MEKILSQLEENGRLTSKQLAAMNGISEAEAAAAVKEYEADGIILGYLDGMSAKSKGFELTIET